MDGFALVAGPAGELELVGEARAGHPWDEPVVSRAGGADLHRRGRAAGRHRGDPGRAHERERRAACRWRTPPRARTSAEPERTCGPAMSCSSAACVSGRPSWAWPPRWVAPSSSCARTPRVALLVTGDELVHARGAARAGPDLLLERLRARRAGSSGPAASWSAGRRCPTPPRPPARRSPPRSTPPTW